MWALWVGPPLSLSCPVHRHRLESSAAAPTLPVWNVCRGAHRSRHTHRGGPLHSLHLGRPLWRRLHRHFCALTRRQHAHPAYRHGLPRHRPQHTLQVGQGIPCARVSAGGFLCLPHTRHHSLVARLRPRRCMGGIRIHAAHRRAGRFTICRMFPGLPFPAAVLCTAACTSSTAGCTSSPASTAWTAARL